MRGTIVCGVTDNAEGRDALELAADLSRRLGLRLVLAHVADVVPSLADDGPDSVRIDGRHVDAARLLARLAAEHGVADRADQRSAVGDPAALLGQIAMEEAADLIVVGSRPRGRLRRGLESRLADQLETETSLPVLIAPPRTKGRQSPARNGAGP